MKFVINLRKGQCENQPNTKYKVPPVSHGIWKLGSPLTFGLSEMHTFFHTTCLTPHWAMCLVKALASKTKPLIPSVMLPLSKATALRWAHTGIVCWRNIFHSLVLYFEGSSESEWDCQLPWAGVNEYGPSVRTAGRINSPLPQHNCCCTATCPKELGCRWCWGGRWGVGAWL